MSLKEILFIGPDVAASDLPPVFERVLLGEEVQRVNTVDEALAYFHGLQRDSVLAPAIVLVSSMVESDGLSKLVSLMRGERTLRGIPIVVLTSVAHECSSKKPLEMASHSYFVRVSDTDALLEIISKHLPDSNGGRPLHHASLA